MSSCNILLSFNFRVNPCNPCSIENYNSTRMTLMTRIFTDFHKYKILIRFLLDYKVFCPSNLLLYICANPRYPCTFKNYNSTRMTLMTRIFTDYCLNYFYIDFLLLENIFLLYSAFLPKFSNKPTSALVALR